MKKILILACFLLSTNLFSQDKLVTADSTYFIADLPPEFIGGPSAMFKFIGMNIRYPLFARENVIEGAVYVGFVIDTDGSVVDITVKGSKLTRSYFDKKTKKLLSVKIDNDQSLQQESMRVISIMPKWKPGSMQGKLVRVAYVLPVKFRLE